MNKGREMDVRNGRRGGGRLQGRCWNQLSHKGDRRATLQPGSVIEQNRNMV